MARRHRRIFPRHGMRRRTESGPFGSALGYADYWPLTVTPQAMKPRRSKPWSADHRRADRAQRRSYICIPSRYSGLVAARHRASQKDAMRAGETELQMCVRHVAEQENRVARQEVLIERLRESRSAILDDALRLLD